MNNREVYWHTVYYDDPEHKALIYSQSFKCIEAEDGEGYIYALTNFDLLTCLMMYNIHGTESHNHATTESCSLVRQELPVDGTVECVIATHGNHLPILREIDFKIIENVEPCVEYGYIDVKNIEKAREYDLVSFIEPGYPTQTEVYIPHRYPSNYYVYARHIDEINELEQYIELAGADIHNRDRHIIVCKIYHPHTIVKLAKHRLVSKIEPIIQVLLEDDNSGKSLKAKYYCHLVSDPLPKMNSTSVRFSPY